jgi:hypothetical protein
MVLRRSLAVAALLLTAGCATTQFRPGKPVDVKEVPLGHQYTQDGLAVRPYSLWDGLEGVEASREEAQAGRAWTIGASVVGAVGGFALGYGVVDVSRGKDRGWPLVASGAAVSAVGVWLGVIGDRHTATAVDQYNRTLSPAPKVSWLPYLAPVAAPAAAGPGARASGAEAGVVLRF